MEYHNSFTNVDPQDDHESEIITSDSATDFAAENVPPIGPTSAPVDALGSVNEEPINSAETLTDATIKDRQLMLADLMNTYAAQMASSVDRRLGATINTYAAQMASSVDRRLGATINTYAAQMASSVDRRLGATINTYAAQMASSVDRRLGATINTYAAQMASSVDRRLGATINTYAAQMASSVDRRLGATINTYAAQMASSVDRRLGATINTYAAQMATVSRRLADLTNPYIETYRRGQLLEKHEWFPHYTMPEFLFGGHIDDADFNALVLAYYRENWAEVRQLIEQNLLDCSADDETKAAFHEALDSHESDRYLSVCRNLIPEMERIVRINLYGDKVGSFSVEKQMDIYFGILPVSVLPDRSLGWVGFKYLQSHLYTHIKNEADRERYVNHQIPNRHAAMHGLVTYDKVQNSLNSIFVADYVLQLITAWKAFERNAILSV